MLRRLLSLVAAGAGLGLLGGLLVTSPGVAADHPAAPAALTDAQKAAFTAGDCNRCHHVPGLEDAGRTDSCQGCHVWIKGVSRDPAKRAKAMQVFPLWERYERNVATYLEVPSLEAGMARLEPEWVASYLRDPHDLRPHLPETMPRFDLDEAQIAAITEVFAAAKVAVPKTARPRKANIEAGELLFSKKGCVACHTFGGRHTLGQVPMAPDLANTRDRMHPDAVAAWIRDPQNMSADATMVAMPMTDAELIVLRDYVMLAPTGAKPAEARASAVQPTEAPVTWEQVEAQVFGKICVHCHMDPAQNQGRAGPGNAGGFGWAETGIELQTYEGVVAVADKIPDALMRRVAEAHRDDVGVGFRPAVVERPERPGMPLGLPPLSEQDLALVLGWIEQGMPR